MTDKTPRVIKALIPCHKQVSRTYKSESKIQQQILQRTESTLSLHSSHLQIINMIICTYKRPRNTQRIKVIHLQE
ncbi:hypothetical protein HanXRQr2_Chr10g0447651 [Helianthus annuus]|uniref:Uncharacterized protein n=1 Tax=Helianthus annuus TaxID=4232 RepID=A0A9K3HYR7_HELAN|nr:hypothetical protein HanXRQr2_Chr10g0447651 [Helianthus annuus]